MHRPKEKLTANPSKLRNCLVPDFEVKDLKANLNMRKWVCVDRGFYALWFLFKSSWPNVTLSFLGETQHENRAKLLL